MGRGRSTGRAAGPRNLDLLREARGPGDRDRPPSGRVPARYEAHRSAGRFGGSAGRPGGHRAHHGPRGPDRAAARGAGALRPPDGRTPGPSTAPLAAVPGIPPQIRPARRTGDRGVSRGRSRYPDGRSRARVLARPPRAPASLDALPGSALVALIRPGRGAAQVPSRAGAARDGKRYRRIRGDGQALACPAVPEQGVRPHVCDLGAKGRPNFGASLASDRDLPQARQSGACRLCGPDARSAGSRRRRNLGPRLSPPRPDRSPGGAGPARAAMGTAGRRRHRLHRPAHPGCRRQRLAGRLGGPVFHSVEAGCFRVLAHRARVRAGPSRARSGGVDRTRSGRRP